MRVLLTLQYLGTRYAGWQAQENALAVQQVVETALAALCGQAVRVTGASRTDAGVHAEDQKAHFDLPVAIPLRGLLLGLNDRLPRDVRATEAREVDPEFNARFLAVSKTYRYQIWNAEIADVFRAATWTHVRAPLDVGLMTEASRALVGPHDFRSYTVAGPNAFAPPCGAGVPPAPASRELSSGAGVSPMLTETEGGRDARTTRANDLSATSRAIDAIELKRYDAAITMRVTAAGFLRYMVRRIAGQLIEIGRGKLPVAATAEALEPAFAEARWTAPPEGLVLERVRYEWDR